MRNVDTNSSRQTVDMDQSATTAVALCSTRNGEAKDHYGFHTESPRSQSFAVPQLQLNWTLDRHDEFASCPRAGARASV